MRNSTEPKEIWKDVVGYEGHYSISSSGNIKSLKFDKERILKYQLNDGEYYRVHLSLNGKLKRRSVHQLVAEAFLNHVPCGFELVVEHKNQIKTDNRVENLEIITQRKNTNRKHLKSTSKYTGVHWNKKRKKWVASIHINGTTKYLGRFINEIDAHFAYEKEDLKFN